MFILSLEEWFQRNKFRYFLSIYFQTAHILFKEIDSKIRVQTNMWLSGHSECEHKADEGRQRQQCVYESADCREWRIGSARIGWAGTHWNIVIGWLNRRGSHSRRRWCREYIRVSWAECRSLSGSHSPSRRTLQAAERGKHCTSALYVFANLLHVAEDLQKMSFIHWFVQLQTNVTHSVQLAGMNPTMKYILEPPGVFT